VVTLRSGRRCEQRDAGGGTSTRSGSKGPRGRVTVPREQTLRSKTKMSWRSSGASALDDGTLQSTGSEGTDDRFKTCEVWQPLCGEGSHSLTRPLKIRPSIPHCVIRPTHLNYLQTLPVVPILPSTSTSSSSSSSSSQHLPAPGR
jgi:hypothetical protein